MPKVSLIIPTYNREDVLCNTITLALKQNYSDYEIVVIDQTFEHEPATSKFLEVLPPIVKLVQHQPPSLPGARNKGIQVADGEIIIMVDDDVILSEDFIDQHLKYYNGDKNTCVTGKIKQSSKFISKISTLINNEFVKWISAAEFQNDNERIAYRAAGGNFSFRKSAAYEAGLFDTNFIGTAWGEDYDFSLRLKNIGYNIIYSPDAVLFHLNEPSGGVGNRSRFNRNTIFSKSHNLAYLIEKHGLSRKFYFYLIWYIYKQAFFKKDYISSHGMIFIILGNLFFLRGLNSGFKKGLKVTKS